MEPKQILFDRTSGQVFQESGMFAATDRVRLLYPASRIIKVENPALGISYQAGADWIFDAVRSELCRPAGSRIAALTPADLSPDPATARFFPDEQANAIEGGIDGKLVIFNNHDFFARHQIEITYQVQPDTVFPKFPAGKHLQRTMQKLTQHETLKIVLLGDSISEGFNATAFVGVEPFGKSYINRFADDLAQRFNCKTELFNDAKDGKNSSYALERHHIWQEQHPDLLIIAFGTNDLRSFTDEEFAENLRKIILLARQDDPQVDIILVTPLSGNPRWKYTPPGKTWLFAKRIRDLAEEQNTALADVQTVWNKILLRKTFYDLTGNGVNHPNDYGHRIYQAVLSALFTGSDGTDNY